MVAIWGEIRLKSAGDIAPANDARTIFVTLGQGELLLSYAPLVQQTSFFGGWKPPKKEARTGYLDLRKSRNGSDVTDHESRAKREVPVSAYSYGGSSKNLKDLNPEA